MQGDKGEAPAISVLITCYEIRDYIAKTLESVLEQECSYPYEILVGDDGSQDGTAECVEDYCARYPGRITLYRMPRDPQAEYNRVERSAANRLHLLRHACGRYVSFLDGDDYYIDRNRLQRMTDILEREENADCILCAHNLLLVWQDGHTLPLARLRRERKIRLEEYWKVIFLQSNALLFRNVYRERLPEGALARVYDDNNITCDLLRRGKMYYLPECMGAYRQVEGSSWNAIDLVRQSASNMIGYTVERELLPGRQYLSDIRHYPDLRRLYRHRAELSAERLSPFYQTAEALGLTESLRVYRMGQEQGLSLREIRRRLRRGGCGYLAARLSRAVKKMLGRY